MSFFHTTAAVNLPCTTFVHRPAGHITGAREVFDEASRIAVTAFPMSMVRDIIASKAMMPACYLLSSHDRGSALDRAIERRRGRGRCQALARWIGTPSSPHVRSRLTATRGRRRRLSDDAEHSPAQDAGSKPMLLTQRRISHAGFN
jgi:hypothetical protein